MRALCDTTPEEGVSRLTLLLSRITFVSQLEDGTPLHSLATLVRSVSDGDIACAVFSFHELTRRLFETSPRRVSGDIFKDYIISLLIEGKHQFSHMAAAGEMDRALFAAMRNELSVLGELAQLSSDDISWLISERSRELKLKPHHVKDNIALMSTAIWSGGQKQAPKEEPIQVSVNTGAVPQDGEWHSFKYEKTPVSAGFSGEGYVADEALEEIYLKLSKTQIWASLIDELYSLFAAYGDGEFLRHRAFVFSYGTLSPMRVVNPPLPVSFYEAQRVAIMDNTISFMRGDHAENLCLYGGAGTGKTYMMLSLLCELPEVRLISLDITSFKFEYGEALQKLVRDISCEPLRFILLLDGFDLENEGVRAFLRRAEISGQPGNVLLYACSRQASDSTIFTTSIFFPYPKPQEFFDTVTELIAADGYEINAEDVRSACIDERAESRDCLSLPAAIRVAKRCIEGR